MTARHRFDLKTWKDIAAHLSDVTGIDIDAEEARALSRRKRNPLPVAKWGRKVATATGTLDEWAAREWKSTPQ